MISKKLETKLSPLLLSLTPFAILIIYLKLNNLLNENNILVRNLSFIVIMMTALIILTKTIISLQRLTSTNSTNYNLKFINYVLWVITSLFIEYFTTISQLKAPIMLANGIIAIYIFMLINQYFNQKFSSN